MSELPQTTSPPSAVVRILIARTGWGRNQAEAFADELLADEASSILACGTAPEHRFAAKTLLDEISDRVRKRRAAASDQ